MFDARAVVNVKVFKISGSSGEFRVSAVSTDGTETELKNTRTKQYFREVGQDGVSVVVSTANFSSSAVGEQATGTQGGNIFAGGNVSIHGDAGNVRVENTQNASTD